MTLSEPASLPLRLVAYGAREPEWFEDALYASEASREVTDTEVHDALYDPGSVVPSGGWLRMQASAFEVVDPRVDAALDRRSVVHFRVPPDELPAFEGLDAVVHMDKAGIDASPVAQAIDDWFTQWIQVAFGVAGGLHRLGVSSNYPGMYTATFDRRTARLIGLHIDSWDGIRLGERRRARYRACFNAGPEPRWFLFAPATLDALAAAMHPDGYDDDTAFHPRGCDLLAVGAIRRIAALRMLPGEGYLAPTDAIYHDVSTLWSTRANLNAQLLFDPDGRASLDAAA